MSELEKLRRQIEELKAEVRSLAQINATMLAKLYKFDPRTETKGVEL